jgi:hypothetical protein
MRQMLSHRLVAEFLDDRDDLQRCVLLLQLLHHSLHLRIALTHVLALCNRSRSRSGQRYTQWITHILLSLTVENSVNSKLEQKINLLPLLKHSEHTAK